MDVNRDLVICTVVELISVEINTIEETLVERTYLEEGEEVDNADNNIGSVTFYNDIFSCLLDNNATFIFMQDQLAVQVRTMFAQGNNITNKTWIPIDNQSIIDLFYNGDFLTDIRKVNDHVVVTYQDMDQYGTTLMG